MSKYNQRSIPRSMRDSAKRVGAPIKLPDLPSTGDAELDGANKAYRAALVRYADVVKVKAGKDALIIDAQQKDVDAFRVALAKNPDADVKTTEEDKALEMIRRATTTTAALRPSIDDMAAELVELFADRADSMRAPLLAMHDQLRAEFAAKVDELEQASSTLADLSARLDLLASWPAPKTAGVVRPDFAGLRNAYSGPAVPTLNRTDYPAVDAAEYFSAVFWRPVAVAEVVDWCRSGQLPAVDETNSPPPQFGVGSMPGKANRNGWWITSKALTNFADLGDPAVSLAKAS